MRKIFLRSVMFGLLVFFGVNVDAAIENDGGFEEWTSGSLNRWSHQQAAGATTSVLTQENTTKTEANYSLYAEFYNNSGPASYILGNSLSTSIDRSKSYRFIINYYPVSIGGLLNSNNRLYVRLWQYDSNNTLLDSWSIACGTGQISTFGAWKTFSFDFGVGTSRDFNVNTSYVLVSIGAENWYHWAGFLDNTRIVEIDEPYIATGIIANNGGLETWDTGAPEYWTHVQQAGASNSVLSHEDTITNQGDYSLYAELYSNSGPGSYLLGNSIATPLDSGKRYRFEMDYYPTSDNNIALSAEIWQYNYANTAIGTYQVSKSSPLITSGGEINKWYTLSFEFGEGTDLPLMSRTAYGLVKISCANWYTWKGYIDNVRIFEISDMDRFRILNHEGKGEKVIGGVYLYPWLLGPGPQELALETHLRTLAQKGFNNVYIVAQDSSGIDPDDIITMCRKYNMTVFFQIGDAYLSESDTSATIAAKCVTAAAFIENRIGIPDVLGFVIKEEPTASFVPTLYGCYESIANSLSVNKIPFYTLFDQITCTEAAYSETYHPAVMGMERYAYRWEYFSSIGYCTTPLMAQYLLYTDFPNYKQWHHKDQWSTAVVSCNAYQTTNSKSYLQAQAPDYYSRWLSLAQAENQALEEHDADIKSWNHWHAPVNGARAQVWNSIACGARTVLLWDASPGYGDSAMGPDGKGHMNIDEHASAIREIQKFGWIINRMEYLGAAIEFVTPSATINGGNADIFQGSFKLPIGYGYDGKIAIIVNNEIGTWDGYSTNKYWLATNNDFQINALGDPVDFTPAVSALTVSLANNQTAVGDMYDLATGQKIGNGTQGNISIEPGGGKVIYIGNESELADIRFKCGMTSTIRIWGTLYGDSNLPDTRRIIHSVDPIDTNTGYAVASGSMLLNNKYRVHVTAGSSDGAQLGVVAIGYNSAQEQVQTEHMGLWNISLSSEPATFVGNEVEIDDEDAVTALCVFHRSNQSGTIKIYDAWLEDVENHKRVTSYYYGDTNQLDPSLHYRVHVVARNLSTDSTGATLGVKINEWQGTTKLNEYHIIPWNTALTSDGQEFVSERFTGITTGTDYLQVVFYKANSSSAPDSTLVIEKAWIEIVE